MRTVFILLVIASMYAFASGMLDAESAPQQAVAAGIGCFIAILARIAQAQYFEDKKTGGGSVKDIFVKKE